uniref:Uncharacterized protein n=1 Tax=Arundo donax TaxID=35708 RepID=A0A0A9GZ83_ARUDO
MLNPKWVSLCKTMACFTNDWTSEDDECCIGQNSSQLSV